MGGVRMVKISSMARFLSAALGFWLALAVGAHAQLVQDGNFNTTGTWNYSHGANYTTGSSCDGSSGGCATIGHSGSDYISQSSSSSLAIGTYTLTLDLNAVSGSTTFSIAVTGGAGSTVTLSTISPSGTATVGWSAYTVTVTVANAALTNPVLTITNTGNTNSLLLDNVSLVVKTPGPIPGAGALSYLMFGLAGFGLRGRKLIGNVRSRLGGRGRRIKDKLGDASVSLAAARPQGLG